MGAKNRKSGRRRKSKKKSILAPILIFILLLAAGIFLFYTCRTQQEAARGEGPKSEQGGPDLPGEPPPDTSRPDKPERQPEELSLTDTIRIFSFNIQVFGQSKMAKPEVVNILADIVSRSDLTAVQEVRSVAIEPVEQFMRLLPSRYAYVLGPREGRTSSKEQYWFIYNTERMTVKDYRTWDDPHDVFERNPLAVYFETAGKFDFIVINNHIQPSSAAEEIAALPGVVGYYRQLWGEPDVLVVGDFNADGSYFNENFMESIFDESGYFSIISNEYDTTVAANEHTYDRFIITLSAREDFTGSFGVLRFDELYDFSRFSILPRHVSDHYPVWAEFYLNMDTD
ncbi:MAG: endonuclease [Treponema sp.]|jgi:endonuclease/exonuclease/phosphatase family metal-dependent hydrolase|nr:endonuclease [Treponema sp.]